VGAENRLHTTQVIEKNCTGAFWPAIPVVLDGDGRAGVIATLRGAICFDAPWITVPRQPRRLLDKGQEPAAPAATREAEEDWNGKRVRLSSCPSGVLLRVETIDRYRSEAA
jgi:hypothetical protein